MKLQIYASCETDKGRFLQAIDEREGELEAVINDLLSVMWETETTRHPSMLVTDDTGKLLASLTMVDYFGPVDGLVEVYKVGGLWMHNKATVERFRVTYKLDDKGGYDHTEINPAR
jgi:hypothetical protein